MKQTTTLFTSLLILISLSACGNTDFSDRMLGRPEGKARVNNTQQSTAKESTSNGIKKSQAETTTDNACNVDNEEDDHSAGKTQKKTKKTTTQKVACSDGDQQAKNQFISPGNDQLHERSKSNFKDDEDEDRRNHDDAHRNID